MSVRHIHANPGEYIAVHRNGGYKPTYQRRIGGGGGGGGSSIGEVIGCIIPFVLFYCFIYKINIISLVLCIALTILAFALCLGLIILIGWLVYKYRTQIGKGFCVLGVFFWHVLCWLATYAWKMLTCAYSAINSRWLKRARTVSSTAPESSTQRPKDYGKIIQKF